VNSKDYLAKRQRQRNSQSGKHSSQGQAAAVVANEQAWKELTDVTDWKYFSDKLPESTENSLDYYLNEVLTAK